VWPVKRVRRSPGPVKIRDRAWLMVALDPQWAGGRPRQISDEDIDVIVAAATTRPEKLGLPFTCWSLRKLAAYLASHPGRPVRVGRERLRQILHARGISFQRTRTWKESADPDRDAKLDRIEHVTSNYTDRCFAFDQFGPLSIRPCHGSSWAPRAKPARLRATYHRTHGIRYFHGCYSLADDQRWGVTRERKGADHTLAALQSIRAARPGGYRLFVILDNLSANKTPAIRRWAERANVELCFTPVSASWANPIEAQFGPVRTLSWAARTTPITPCWPASCRTTCAGATPTPATPTSWPPSAANAPASAANASNAGDAPNSKQPDPVNVHGQPTSERRAPWLPRCPTLLFVKPPSPTGSRAGRGRPGSALSDHANVGHLVASVPDAPGLVDRQGGFR
jgi:transposase